MWQRSPNVLAGPWLRSCAPTVKRLLVIAQAMLVSFGLIGGAAKAVEPDEILNTPKLEARARVLSAELRCLVCQNQSIDDSNAPLARDLRLLVRERLKAGDTNDQVLDYVVARYGEFVLLRPRLSASTLLLWFAPLLLLAVGIFLARRAIRGQGAVSADSLTEQEQARLDSILSKNNERS